MDRPPFLGLVTKGDDMAKLEIDERAWSDPRLKRLTAILNGHYLTAVGILAVLWHDSQEQLKGIATEDDLRAWFSGVRLPGRSGHARGIAPSIAIRDALIEAGYLLRADLGWRIAGNERRLVVVRVRKKRARSAADRRWKDATEPGDKSIKAAKPIGVADARGNACDTRRADHQAQFSDAREEEKRREREEERAIAFGYSATPAGAPARSPALLDLATSSCEAPELAADKGRVEGARAAASQSAAHDRGAAPGIDEAPPAGGKARPASKTRQKREKPETGVREIISAYCVAYKERFGQAPIISPSDAGAARQISLAVGAEKGKSLAAAYLSVNDQWFATKSYDLQTLAGNLNKVAMFVEQGIVITKSMAKGLETHSNNKAVAERVIERLQQREAMNDEPW